MTATLAGTVLRVGPASAVVRARPVVLSVVLLGLLAAVPYGLEVRAASARAPDRPEPRALVAAADVAADAVGAVALVWGSLRYRSVVL